MKHALHWTIGRAPMRGAGYAAGLRGACCAYVSIVLEGSQTPRTARTPAQFTMPRFAWRLSDKDVADVVNFIRSSWGNGAPPVSSAEVAKSRKSLQVRIAGGSN